MPIRDVCPICFSDEHLSIAWCPHVWVDEPTGVRVFTPSSYSDRALVDTANAYDFTQTCDEMRDGDVVVCEHNGVQLFAVLVQAWPTAIDGHDVGQLHTLAPDQSWRTLDGGKYLPATSAVMRWRARGETRTEAELRAEFNELSEGDFR